MTPVDQSIIDKGSGDCMRACVASILNLPLQAVPHFLLNGSAAMYSAVFHSFMHAHGWNWKGNACHDSILKWKPYHIDGHYIASVHSRTYEDGSHAVLIDAEGFVTHDPNPNKKWQGESIFSNRNYHYFNTFQKRRDLKWKCIELAEKEYHNGHKN